MTTAARRFQVGDIVNNWVDLPITITGVEEGYYVSAHGGAWVEKATDDGGVCLYPYDAPQKATNGDGRAGPSLNGNGATPQAPSVSRFKIGDWVYVVISGQLQTLEPVQVMTVIPPTLGQWGYTVLMPDGTTGIYAEMNLEPAEVETAAIADDAPPIDAPPVTPSPVTLGERLPLVDLAFLGECYDREELGDGELFAHLYNGRIVYDHAENAWYFWERGHYRRDDTEQVKLLYSGQVAAQYLEGAAVLIRLASEATAAGNKAQADAFSDLAQAFTRRARQLQKKHRATNALDYAAAVLGVKGDIWDICPALLPVANGVVDLATGQLRLGQPEDYIRTYAPYEWRGLDEPCPRWARFVVEIMGGDEGNAEFLQRLLGYGISGLATEHKFPILWGETGRNGKDTLVESLGYALGPLAGAVTKDVIIDPGGRNYSGAPAPHILDLRGKRLVWASEPREGARLDAAQVKLITGGGRLKGRGVYEKSFVEWQPTHLAMLITNPRPHAPADDLALWERLLLIPFTQRFVDSPRGQNEHTADKGLRAKLRTEAAGILAWLVRGYMAWRAEGLNPPTEVTQATAEYRQSEDTLTQFLSEQYTPQSGAVVTANDLYLTYMSWCTAWGINPMSGRTFGEKMKNRLPWQRTTAGVVYIGIKRNGP